MRFAYPAATAVSLASLEEVARLDDRGGVEVLHDVSFRAEPGQMVALVGSSGAGKSTVAQLLPRLYDVDSGAVRIGGVDVRELSFDAIRGALGLVTQDGHLFHESIRSNLLLARPEATEAELWDVLRRARLAELVVALPDGLDTVVGERGYRLSGGERQRLTIARLLLARPRVVVLDEATAHLDSTSEAAVQEALAEALEGRTAVVIAHRLSTIRAADLILVVEGGRIVERGTHPELLARGGRYAELYRTQFDQAADQAREAAPVAMPDERAPPAAGGCGRRHPRLPLRRRRARRRHVPRGEGGVACGRDRHALAGDRPAAGLPDDLRPAPFRQAAARRSAGPGGGPGPRPGRAAAVPARQPAFPPRGRRAGPGDARRAAPAGRPVGRHLRRPGVRRHPHPRSEWTAQPARAPPGSTSRKPPAPRARCSSSSTAAASRWAA